jgi:hypothetical protein
VISAAILEEMSGLRTAPWTTAIRSWMLGKDSINERVGRMFLFKNHGLDFRYN